MSLGRALLCVFLPPLAVWHKGCLSVIVVTLLCCVVWIPGVIVAILMNLGGEAAKERVVYVERGTGRRRRR